MKQECFQRECPYKFNNEASIVFHFTVSNLVVSKTKMQEPWNTLSALRVSFSIKSERTYLFCGIFQKACISVQHHL